MATFNIIALCLSTSKTPPLWKQHGLASKVGSDNIRGLFIVFLIPRNPLPLENGTNQSITGRKMLALPVWWAKKPSETGSDTTLGFTFVIGIWGNPFLLNLTASPFASYWVSQGPTPWSSSDQNHCKNTFLFLACMSQVANLAICQFIYSPIYQHNSSFFSQITQNLSCPLLGSNHVSQRPSTVIR